MLKIELSKLIKSKVFAYSLLGLLLVSSAYLLLIYNSINSDTSLNVNQSFINSLAIEYHQEMCYYMIPFLLIYLVDNIISKQIKDGQVKHIILRTSRARIFISKVFATGLALLLLLALQNLMSFFLLPKVFSLQVISTRPSNFILLLIYLASIVFMASISLNTNRNNFISLLLVQFSILGLSELAGFISGFLYMGQLKSLLSFNKVDMKIILIELVVLMLVYLGIVKRKEFVQ